MAIVADRHIGYTSRSVERAFGDGRVAVMHALVVPGEDGRLQISELLGAYPS